MKDEPENTPSHEESPSILSKILKAIAYPVSAAIGYSYWHAFVRKASLERIRNTGSKHGGGFADLLDTRLVQQDALLKESIVASEFPAKLKLINQEFSKGQATRMEEMGLGSILGRFKSLNRYSRYESILTAVTAAGIALGVILTASESKYFINKMNGTHEDKGVAK